MRVSVPRATPAPTQGEHQPRKQQRPGAVVGRRAPATAVTVGVGATRAAVAGGGIDVGARVVGRNVGVGCRVRRRRQLASSVVDLVSAATVVDPDGVRVARCDRVERVDESPAALLDTCSSARGPRYSPGQRYRIDVAILNESLGPPCDQYMAHHNNFAANFELASGAPAGTLESDSGQIQTSCPPDFTDPQTGTTALYGDCEVVFPRRGENMEAWTFYWTAPSAPPEVRLFYGATDGDCMMTSLGDDDVVVADLTFVAATSAADPPEPGRPGSPWQVAPILVASLAGFGIMLVGRRRGR
jgi:hypothetical protein